MPKPIIPLITVCVVLQYLVSPKYPRRKTDSGSYLTGNLILVAKPSQTLDKTTVQTMPSIRRAGAPAKASTSTMFFLIVNWCCSAPKI